MKFDVNFASFILGLLSACSGWVVWWIGKINSDKQLASQKAADAAKKAYAAERDFEHLKNNFKQMSDGIALGFKGIEDDLIDNHKNLETKINNLNRDIVEIKAYMVIHGRNKHDHEQ